MAGRASGLKNPADRGRCRVEVRDDGQRHGPIAAPPLGDCLAHEASAVRQVIAEFAAQVVGSQIVKSGDLLVG